MAYTSIHAITATVDLSLNYIMSDKTEEKVKDDIADSIHYIMNDKTGEVTYRTLTTTMNCMNLANPVEDFHALMNTFGRDEIQNGNAKTKDGAPILAWHLIQSFEGQVDPRIANEIGQKLARELFGNYAVVVSTHTNTEDTHNHIEFSAWNLDGKKYNYDHEAYDKIRSVSDRLCDEYGLSVIEHARDRKLVRWEDEEGKTHYFEPTDRKLELIRKREEGELTNDDIGSYRNTAAYEASQKKKQTNTEIVKQAIDSKLPYATSYEHLLAMLREMGFKIKDKKKDGRWREHVTFTPPTAERGVRDYKIGEDNYYTRVNLTALIEERNKHRQTNEKLQSELKLPYYETYEYGEVDVQKINEDYRLERVPENGPSGFKVVQRGEAEKAVIRDIKKADIALTDRYDLTYLNRIIAEQKAEAQTKKFRQTQPDNTRLLVRQIQESFVNLKFMEEKQLYSYAQINDIVKGLWDQHNACLSKISEAEAMIEKLEGLSKLPGELREIKQRMDRKKGDPEYMMEQFAADMKRAKEGMEELKKHDVTTAEGIKELQASVQKYRNQIVALQTSLSAISVELANYNRCVATLARIDQHMGRDYSEMLEEYQDIVRAGQEQAEDQQERQAQEKEKKKRKGWDR